MRRDVHRPMLNRGAGGVFAEIVVAPPVHRGTDRSRRKSAAAVGAYVFEDTIHALYTERAFVRTDARVSRLRWQRSIAMLASRPEFKHWVVLYATSLSILANVLRHNQELRLVSSSLLPVTISLSASFARASVV